MADTQISGPLTNQPFTDEQWRDSQGDDLGIRGDRNGTSYDITLPPNSDQAAIGSATQDSAATVGGFVHKIPAGQAQTIEIPQAVGGTRTDIIALRYDPAWGSAAPGPVRLVRIPGTVGAGRPTYDASPPGGEDFPLWAVTRAPGQSLSQATAVPMRLWASPVGYVETSGVADLPRDRPVGSRVRLGQGYNAREFMRVIDDQGNVVWQENTPFSPSGVATARRTASNVIANNLGTAASVTLPQDAPTGRYLVTYTAVMVAPQTVFGYLRGVWGTSNITGDDPITLSPGVRASHTITIPIVHDGGPAYVAAVVFSSNANVAISVCEGSRVTAVWVGTA